MNLSDRIAKILLEHRNFDIHAMIRNVFSESTDIVILGEEKIGNQSLYIVTIDGRITTITLEYLRSFKELTDELARLETCVKRLHK